MVYKVELPDLEKNKFSINIISENMIYQVYLIGNYSIILDGIVYYKRYKNVCDKG